MGGVGGGGYGCTLGNALGSVQIFLRHLGVGVVDAWYRGSGTLRVRGVL